VKVGDFDYELPEALVAQHPAPERDESRLMVLARATGTVEHRWFRELPDLLRRGDLVVVNDARVRCARLWGRKESGARVEILMLEPVPGEAGASDWRALVRSSGRLRPGTRVTIADGLCADLVRRHDEAWIVRVLTRDDVEAALERFGVMPLPPYIRRAADDPRHALDRERYQTVFAERRGSAVAAPTAGLHFTPRLLEALASRGIERSPLTLEVGVGTFQPVRCEEVERHSMHPETFRIPEATAAAVGAARARGGRVVAIGTTVVRSLETAAAGEGRVSPGAGRCDLFIYPGYRFQVVDAMVTNFHLPRSTLVMLVSAFAGRERVLDAYREAIRERYRFYSYGDAMLIV
jgi:S-adenosylmethionine:tRNA ribosyltransferase-isomerase